MYNFIEKPYQLAGCEIELENNNLGQSKKS